jgi:hypothetical protein
MADQTQTTADAVNCPACAGSTLVVYDPATDQFDPYDERRATGHDEHLVTLCWDCTDGRRLA